jgi:peptidoglycan/xylan/chitin deacetylase (PgdA/CDA1 family)
MQEMKRSVRLIISLGFMLMIGVGDLLNRIFGRARKARCVVLYYHAIPAGQRQPFARQMDILLRWVGPIRADHKGDLPPGHNYAVVTFDDGFQSVATNALPELAKRGIPTAIFVASGCLGRAPAWLSEGYAANNSETTLTPDELRALPGPLVTLGSHTVSHPRLTRLPSEEVRREMEESRRQLEKISNQPVTLFSFPYGAFNAELVRFCREAGYERAFTIEPLLAFSDPREFLTGRVAVSPSDWPLEFWLKLLGCYRWQATVSAFKRSIVSGKRHRKSMNAELPEDANESLAN